jgi:hypothetical protein
MDTKMYFVCSKPFDIQGRQSPGALLRIKATNCAPNIAFTTLELGKRFLTIRDMGNEYFLIADSQLTEDHSFNFDEDYVLIIDSEALMTEFIANPTSFNYSQHLFKHKHGIASKYPW